MNRDPASRDAMIAAIPRRRAVAGSLSGLQQADELVQQTLLQACSKILEARQALIAQLEQRRRMAVAGA